MEVPLNKTTSSESYLPFESRSPTPKLIYQRNFSSISHYSPDKCQPVIQKKRSSHKDQYIYRYHPKTAFATDRRLPIQSIILIVNHLVDRLFPGSAFNNLRVEHTHTDIYVYMCILRGRMHKDTCIS